MLTKTGYFSPLTPKNQLKNFYQIGGWVVLQEKCGRNGGSDQHMTLAIGSNAREVGAGGWWLLAKIAKFGRNFELVENQDVTRQFVLVSPPARAW